MKEQIKINISFKRNAFWKIQRAFILIWRENMENEYKIILNMQDEMFNILKKSIEDDGYNIILRDEKVMFIEKSKENLTDEQIKRIVGIAKMQKVNGILFVDISQPVNYLKKIANEKVKNDVKFRTMLRQAFIKAIVEKNKT